MTKQEMKHVSKLEFGNKFGCSAYRYYHNHQPSALKLVLVKQKKKVSRTSSGTYSVILHDKTASANFLDEVRVKSVNNCHSVDGTGGSTKIAGRK